MPQFALVIRDGDRYLAPDDTWTADHRKARRFADEDAAISAIPAMAKHQSKLTMGRVSFVGGADESRRRYIGYRDAADFRFEGVRILGGDLPPLRRRRDTGIRVEEHMWL